MEGAIIFRVLIVGRLVVFLGQIYAWGLAAVGADTELLLACLLGAVSSVALNVVMIPAFGLVGAAVVSVGVEFLIHVTCFLLLRKHVHVEARSQI